MAGPVSDRGLSNRADLDLVRVVDTAEEALDALGEAIRGEAEAGTGRGDGDGPAS